MKVLAFSLREEARISGEAASFRLLESVFGDLGIPLECPRAGHSHAAPLVGALRRLRQLKEISAANAADILLVKIPTAAQLPATVSATRQFRGRVIFWIDGLLWRSPISIAQWRKFFIHEPLLIVARALMNNAAWTRSVCAVALEIVVSSQVQAAELAPLLPKSKIHVVPNGTPPQPAAGKVGASRPFTAGYIGHSYLVKGVWEILDALRQMRQTQREIPFRFALSGLGGAQFQQAASAAQIEVLGEVERAAFFASIDLLVAPFWVAWGTQTFPNVLLEAMQYGVPVLTTDLPVCRELFPDGLAYFIPPHDASALAAALSEIARGQLAHPSPARLRAHFAAHYSPARIADGWRRILLAHDHTLPQPTHA